MSNPDKIWYLPNDELLQPDGPFTTEEVAEMLGAGRLNLDSFIFCEKFRTVGWKRIFEVSEFTSALKKRPVCPIPRVLSRGAAQHGQPEFHFEKVKGEYGIENLYRRFPRAPASFSCFVHDETQLVQGRISNISETGVLFVLDQPDLFKEGDELILTVRGPRPIGTFSARAIVMRIFHENRTEVIGVYFLRLNPAVRRKIAKYILDELSDAPKDKAV